MALEKAARGLRLGVQCNGGDFGGDSDENSSEGTVILIRVLERPLAA